MIIILFVALSTRTKGRRVGPGTVAARNVKYCREQDTFYVGLVTKVIFSVKWPCSPPAHKIRIMSFTLFVKCPESQKLNKLKGLLQQVDIVA